MNKVKKIICLLVLYAVLISIITYPLCSFLIPGNNFTVIGDSFSEPDLEGTLWFYWWTGYSWEKKLNFFYSEYMNYPYGYNLWVPGSFLTIFIFQPVIKICGLIKGYNFSVFIILLLNSLSVFLLLKELVKKKTLAFLGGALIILDYFFVREMINGRLEILSVFWMIFYLYSLVRLRNTKKIKYIFISALFFLLANLSSWYYGVIICCSIFVWMIMLVYSRQWKDFKFALFSFFLGGILFLPFFLVFFSNFYSNYENFLSSKILQRNCSQFLSDIHDDSWDLYLANIFLPRSSFPKVSMVLFVFSFVGVVANREIRKQYTGWFFFWIVSLVFSLGIGYVLQFSSRVLSSRLPFYYLVENFPLIYTYSFSKPYRFLSLFSLASIVIITLTVNSRFKKKDIYKFFFLGGVFSLMIIESAVYTRDIFPMKSSKLEVPSIYYKLAQLPPGAVLKLPYNNRKQGCLYYQTIHQKKMFNDNWYSLSFLVCLKQRDFTSAVGLLENGWIVRKKEDIDFFRRLGLKYVIFDEKETLEMVKYSLPELEEIKTRFRDILGESYMSDLKERLFLYILDG